MKEQLAGHDVWVRRLGDGPRPDIYIHCALASHDAMLPLAQRRGRSAILFDMPGHGRSGPWDGIRDYQAVVAEIVSELTGGVASHLIGHSFGATAALRLAVLSRVPTARLTLIEPVFFAAARGTSVHAAHQRNFAPFVEAMAGGDRSKAAEIFHGLWGQGAWDDLSPRVRHHLTDRIHLIVAGGPAIEEDNAQILRPGLMEGFNRPVTLIRGNRTQPVISEIHAALRHRLPITKEHVVAGAGHMVALTHAVEIAELMASEEREEGIDRLGRG